jgi:hypothetical protein
MGTSWRDALCRAFDAVEGVLTAIVGHHDEGLVIAFELGRVQPTLNAAQIRDLAAHGR